MIVVSDTSAITSLIQIDRAALLASVFERVIIPAAVRDELLVYHKAIPDFIEVRFIGDTTIEMEDLDRGEMEAIILAEQLKPDFVLIDDFAARSVAIAKGLPVIGLLGVLVKAKRRGAIDSLRSVLDDLEITAGFGCRRS